MVSSPRVFIGMPVFNGGNLLAASIESLLSQEFVDFRLLISDNSSSDASREVIMHFARRDERVEPYFQENNNGAWANFQFVLSRASSEFFMFAAHDDLWTKNHLADAVSALDRSGGSAFSPNWFVGDLNRSRGYSPKTHVLSDLCGKTTDERVIQFFNTHHLSHKCNLIYGVFKTELMKNSVKSVSYGNDGLICAKLLQGSDLIVSDSVTYLKSGKRFSPSGSRSSIPVSFIVNLRNLRRHDRRTFKSDVLRGLSESVELFPHLRLELEEIAKKYRTIPYHRNFRISSLIS